MKLFQTFHFCVLESWSSGTGHREFPMDSIHGAHKLCMYIVYTSPRHCFSSSPILTHRNGDIINIYWKWKHKLNDLIMLLIYGLLYCISPWIVLFHQISNIIYNYLYKCKTFLFLNSLVTIIIHTCLHTWGKLGEISAYLTIVIAVPVNL